ncbi:helix-turn-helix domain-containing protein [Nonomuraea gerenzanensis]|uniref:Conserved hypothetical secreted protein n=1 Tax=Nonomuraea gerenzanensis TaxID=93944 RepID=A0A1M4E6Z3_9ACTN|nr:helix-turn-helix domain-containing protein [Nonomuraea gerenzanensis]UBU16798.1 helix-turn-helix domain-containing protein [Nonomuraea gerenzanensis]SBO94508.1 conserved hypothetical secreted protein [Nonomuraea gerenzanensis]
MSDTWTIGELSEHAARALRAGAPAPVNGRVRDVPGERLIRWYTTIGLVDPPLTRRGRVARYGRRHLLQLVAVKRLQAAGRSIAEIQAALAGATDRMLEAAARLESPPAPPQDGPLPVPPQDGPSPVPPLDGPSPVLRPDGGEPVRGRFWAERPGSGATHARDAAPAPAAEAQGTTVPGTPYSAGSPSQPGDPRPPHSASRSDRPRRGTALAREPGARPTTAPGHDTGAVVTGIRLGNGVRLVLDAGRPPTEEDVQAVLAAARPLLAVLEERKLT